MQFEPFPDGSAARGLWLPVVLINVYPSFSSCSLSAFEKCSSLSGPLLCCTLAQLSTSPTTSTRAANFQSSTFPSRTQPVSPQPDSSALEFHGLRGVAGHLLIKCCKEFINVLPPERHIGRAPNLIEGCTDHLHQCCFLMRLQRVRIEFPFEGRVPVAQLSPTRCKIVGMHVCHSMWTVPLFSALY